MALYGYLRRNEIRLLSVHREDGDSSIKGEFKNISLDEEHPRRYRANEKKLDYFAVSYVWGISEHLKPIEVDGHQLGVTPNAHRVLEMFCNLPQREHKAWIWIDAVCINQQDSIERSVQVSLMSSIYSRAKRGIVWLGEGNESTDVGIELMRTLSMGKNGYPVSQQVIKDPISWAGFVEVAARPWWRRAWTLQESAIPSDLVYYCGSKCLTADEVRNAVLVASSYSYLQTESPLEKASLAPLWHRRRIYQWLGHQDLDDDFEGYGRRRPGAEPKLGDISLLSLLAYQRHAMASDPRDYIYSLLGCVKEKDRQLVGPPSYDSEISEVYRNLVRNWVLSYGSLDIIAFAQLFRGKDLSPDPDFPSWTPDWSVRLDILSEESNAVPLLVSQPVNKDVGSMLPPRFLRNEGRRYMYGQDDDELPRYAASKDMALRVCFSKDLKVMECTGIVIGIVDGVSCSSWQDTETYVQTTSSMNHASASSQDLSFVAADIMLSLCFGRADVYLQYEANGRYLLNEVLDPTTGMDCSGYHDFRKWIEVNSGLKIRGTTVKNALQSADPSNLPEDEPADRPRRLSYSRSVSSDVTIKVPEDEEASKHPLPRKFKTATHPQWMDKRLIVTETGSVGMAPRDVQKGDIVYVLLGCNVPMVLRPVSAEHFLVVGECYLHGYMGGEALEGDYKACNLTLI